MCGMEHTLRVRHCRHGALLSVDFRRPCASGVGQRSRASSWALPQNPSAATARSWRGCEQLPGAWVPATISHPCQAHFSCSRVEKQLNRWWLTPFSGILETHQSTHWGTKRKGKKKKKPWKCSVEIKWWFKRDGFKRKLFEERCVVVSTCVHKPGAWEQRPGTTFFTVGRSGYSQEADTKWDWPSLVTQNTPSSKDAGAELQQSCPNFYACLKITQFLPGSKCNFKSWKLDHEKKGGEKKREIDAICYTYFYSGGLNTLQTCIQSSALKSQAGTEGFCFLPRGKEEVTVPNVFKVERSISTLNRKQCHIKGSTPAFMPSRFGFV